MHAVGKFALPNGVVAVIHLYRTTLACLLAVHVVIVWYHVVSWEWVTFVERIAEIDCVYVDK